MTLPGPVLERSPGCRDDQRRGDVQLHPTLNGIDYVEYRREGDPVQHYLDIHFIKPLPKLPYDAGTDGAYGLTVQQNRVRLHGGTRVLNIAVLDVTKEGTEDYLRVQVAHAGDFSTYWLTLGWVLQPDGSWLHVIPALDPRLSIEPVNFRAGCPVEFDCRQPAVCDAPPAPEPLIDYLAKDYASFRRLLLDLLPQHNPEWLERNPADLGIALIELLAYTGDYLSYFQDAVANEAYLDTARHRVSTKRHARLVDYHMHDGRNAWTYVHFAVGTKAGTIPQRARLLTRVTRPLIGQTGLPGPTVESKDIGFDPLVPGTGPGVYPDPALDRLRADPALQPVRVFETAHPTYASPLNNEIRIHTWGDLDCCLPRGTTSVYLYALESGEGSNVIAVRPPLQKGDFLLLEEVLSPASAGSADADRTHRAVVRITEIEDTWTDPVYGETMENGRPAVRADVLEKPLPLLRVIWDRAEALAFPLCVSARTRDGTPILDVALARGNMALADHGLTVREIHRREEAVPPDARFRLPLREAPLTMQCPPAATVEPDMQLETPRTKLSCLAREATPAMWLEVSYDTTGTTREPWTVVPNLLDSGPFSPAVVVDVENDGSATLRFGDGEYGREIAGVHQFDVTYRVGNGRSGEVGAEALAHLIVHPTQDEWPEVTLVRNPLPARDGVDPESIEQVRQYAPAAFHAHQFRAVTEADYVRAALTVTGVAGAVAAFYWTGSWHTVHVGIDPRDPAELVTEPGGRTRLAPELEREVRAKLRRYMLAGYDLELRTARYVPLEIELDLCVLRDHFRADVAEAVRRALVGALGAGRAPFFHPDRFTFGQPVYLSTLYAAIEAVTGVESATIRMFQRFGRAAGGELESGILDIGPWEIARLDADPSAPENGVLRIVGRGGK